MLRRPHTKIKFPTEWNLGELYESPTDPKIQADLAVVLKRAVAFERAHSGKVGKYSAAELLGTLGELSRLVERQTIPCAYAELGFAKNTRDEHFAGLLQLVQSVSVEIDSHLVFFDIEIGKHKHLDRFIADKKTFGPYAIVLRRIRDGKKYHLTEPEEKILNIKSVTSASGWSDLLDKLVGLMEVRAVLGGREHVMSEPQTLQLLYSADRSERREGATGLTTALNKQLPVLTHVYNMLLINHKQNNALRSVELPETSRHIGNGLTQASVDALVSAVEVGYAQVQRFYRIQAKLLGLKKLDHYDRYAPVSGSGKGSVKVSFPAAVKTVEASFRRFDPEFADIFNDLLAKGAVDVHATPGKRSGAFCMQMPRSHHPYVLLNYFDGSRDVETLAHEMGHAVQDVLTSKLPYLVAHPPLALAETASTFAEMVVFDALLDQVKAKEERIELLSGKITQFIATVFRQVAMFKFERLAHGHVRDHGYVLSDALHGYWLSTQREIFGDSISISDGYGSWWSHIPHFYATPFYVYAYSFGNLLVFSLCEKYRDGMPEFNKKYRALLAAGGSKTPQDAVAPFGFSLEDPEFWKNGIALFTRYIDELEILTR